MRRRVRRLLPITRLSSVFGFSVKALFFKLLPFVSDVTLEVARYSGNGQALLRAELTPEQKSYVVLPSVIGDFVRCWGVLPGHVWFRLIFLESSLRSPDLVPVFRCALSV